MAPTDRVTRSANLNTVSQGQGTSQESTIRPDSQRTPRNDANEDEGIEATSLLQEQIRILTENQQRADENQRRTEDAIGQILRHITALRSQETQSPPHENTDRVTDRDTPDSDFVGRSSGASHKYSKKIPDPRFLSDGVDPTFKSWKIQIQGKLRVNSDHFSSEEDKMLYIFNCTQGDAQTHLLPRFQDDSPSRFVSTMEMINHLAAIYINPNEVRDARYEYGRLTMRTTQTFNEFQTTFLQLAGQAQIPQASLQMDLYDRLTTPLQRGIAPTLSEIGSFTQLCKKALSVDSELRRIDAREDRRRQLRERVSGTRSFKPTGEQAPVLRARSAIPSTTLPDTTSARTETPRTREGRVNLLKDLKDVICYNCQQPGHYASACAEPKKLELKEIQEGEELSSGVETSEGESGKEDP